MSGFTDLISLYTSTKSDDVKQALPIVERIYFRYANTVLFSTLKHAEEYKIALDVINIELCLLNHRSLKKSIIRSNQLTNNGLLSNFRTLDSLTPEDISRVENEIVTKLRHYVTSMFLIDTIRREQAMIRNRWIVSVLLALIAAILGFIAKVLMS